MIYASNAERIIGREAHGEIRCFEVARDARG